MKSSDVERALRGARRSGVREDRVAGDRDQRADLPVARRLDLLGQAGDRAARRRPRAARARGSPSGRSATPRPRPGVPVDVRRAGGGPREHRAARAVEVAGEHVEHVDQPARERAELLRAGADAPVDGGALGAGQVARERADRRRRRCRRPAATASGVNGRAQRRWPRRGRSGARRAGRARRGPRRRARCTIAKRRSASVPGRMKRCSSASSAVRRAPRVDDDDPAAALADRAQPPAHVGRGHQAAVRDERVGAEDQQVVGAVDVGHRDAERRRRTSAPARDLLRHLVDGAGGEDVARPSASQEHAAVDERREVVRGRVAEVDGDGVAAAVGEDRGEAAVDLGERLVPGDRLEVARRRATQRRAQRGRGPRAAPSGRALRADEAVAEDVVLVAADPEHLAAVER